MIFKARKVNESSKLKCLGMSSKCELGSARRAVGNDDMFICPNSGATIVMIPSQLLFGSDYEEVTNSFAYLGDGLPLEVQR